MKTYLRGLQSLLLAAFFLVAPTAHAQRSSAKAQVEVEGKRYTCLGSGVRKKLLFKVYDLTFCVEEGAAKSELSRFVASAPRHAGKSGDALASSLAQDPAFFDFLVTMKVAKAAEFAFLRDVSSDQIQGSFRESLSKTLGAGAAPRIEALVKLIDSELHEKERFWMTTAPGGRIAFELKGHKELTDAELARAIWQVYLGAEPVAPALKEAVARGAARLLAQS